MQGDARIIELLNEVLTGELTATNQYFLHAKMQANWGFARLAAHTRDESIGEMKHADILIERILYLEGVPNLQRLFPLRVGETVPEQFALDREVEVEAMERLRRGVALALEAADHGTRDLFERILVSEEAHIDWLETQLELIATLGEQHYLAQQVHES